MEGFIDPILVNRFVNAARSITTNLSTLRTDTGGTSRYSFDRRRDIYAECGFPDSKELTPDRARLLYERDALAARVVEVWPRECWKVLPQIYEKESSKANTPFEISLRTLSKQLTAEPGYYNDEDINSFLEYMNRADINCGIGRFGIVLVGLNDGKTLDQPADVKPNPTGDPSRLSFLRVFDESLVQIAQRETDPNKPRWGQPLSYNITFDNPEDYGAVGSTGAMVTSRVHWTRVVHIVDSPISNEIISQYRIMPVLNDILTAQKPRWGSGEMFWNGASPKLSFETHPQLGGDVQINKDRMRQQMENVMRGLQQWWTLVGMTAKPIAPNATDPKPFVDVSIQSICIKTGVPLPIFIGYEVGENAGTMNTVEWNKRLKERHNRQITPRIICPILNRLINLGILALPQQGYKIDWPDISANTDKDTAQLQSFKVNTVVAYLKNGLNQIIPPVEFLVRFLDMKEDEARTLTDQATQELKKQSTIGSTTLPNTNPTDPANPNSPIPSQDGTDATTAPTSAQDNGTIVPPSAPQGNTDIQATALNGAQISSLMTITDALAQGRYTPEATKAIIQASFPLMDIALIDKMVQEIASKPVLPNPVPAVAPTKPNPPVPASTDVQSV